MIDRRRFMQALLAAAAAPAGRARATRRAGFGRLLPDPRRVLDLPSGFHYDVVSQQGEVMDDGLLVPGQADGMAAFRAPDGNVALVCNYENPSGKPASGPFGTGLERLDRLPRERIYDFGGGVTPGPGGTATILWNPRTRRRLRQHMSLAGTELNCAGGPTPWGSWLSCEECFTAPGTGVDHGRAVTRERRHGYVFEVPADAADCAVPRPLKALGRFEHEAAAVDPASGIVYLSEDRHRGLLYRFLPEVPGRLAAGGRLQALAVPGRPGFDTRNWHGRRAVEAGAALPAAWIDLTTPDSDRDDLRLRGRADGAAVFARGEGLCLADGELILTCTIGGAERLGQIFAYRPGPGEGTSAERPGCLRLLAESTLASLLRHADNVTESPWGDLLVCEDTAEHCGLVGITADGRQYALADNAYSPSELAGVCFAPAGDVLFVNVQDRGLTLAVRGPWPRA